MMRQKELRALLNKRLSQALKETNVKKRNDKLASVDLANEIYHSGASDAEERIKALFLSDSWL